MRVALNLLAFGAQAGGVGRYARELAPALLAVRDDLELHLVAPADAPPWMAELAGHPRVGITRLRVRSSRPLALYPAQLGALAEFAKHARCDVIHGPANFVPLAGGLPSVATIHDVMWIEHAVLSGFTPTSSRIWRALTALAARASDVVLADTEATAGDVVRLLGVPRTKIEVVLLGAGIEVAAAPTPAAELRERLGLGDARVLLSVGQKRPHKNLETVLRALAELPEDVVLVAPGADHGHGAELERLAVELGLADRVRMLAWVSDTDLEGLYGLADVDVQMSFLEGFGLPALEAMQRGVPTVVSTTPALVEATGTAAVVVETKDHRAVAAAIGRILVDDAWAAELVLRGHQRVAELTWEQTARGTLAAYERAIRGA